MKKKASWPFSCSNQVSNFIRLKLIPPVAIHNLLDDGGINFNLHSCEYITFYIIFLYGKLTWGSACRGIKAVADADKNDYSFHGDGIKIFCVIRCSQCPVTFGLVMKVDILPTTEVESYYPQVRNANKHAHITSRLNYQIKMILEIEITRLFRNVWMFKNVQIRTILPKSLLGNDLTFISGSRIGWMNLPNAMHRDHDKYNFKVVSK